MRPFYVLLFPQLIKNPIHPEAKSRNCDRMAAISGVPSGRNRASDSSKKEPIPISETSIICNRFSDELESVAGSGKGVGSSDFRGRGGGCFVFGKLATNDIPENSRGRCTHHNVNCVRFARNMYKQVNGGVSHKYDKKEQQHEVDQPDGKKPGGYAFYEFLHKYLPLLLFGRLQHCRIVCKRASGDTAI